MMTFTDLFSGLCEQPDEDLLAKVVDAHRRAALHNTNVSSNTARSAYVGSGDMGKAMTAAISTFGYLHAPISQAREVITFWSDQQVKDCVGFGGRLPGWGNSFYKDRIDPAWEDVYDYCKNHPSFARVHEITKILASLGKPVLPNAAAFTAYACDEMEWAHGAEIVLVIVARAPTWAVMAKAFGQNNPNLGGWPVI